MLTKKQVKEIRNHLDKAQNPLFFFDSDLDGLCAFLLLRRSVGIGKGVLMKYNPELVDYYLGKIDQFNSDYIFILDSAHIEKRFFEEVRKLNIPVVWIDHHVIDKKLIPRFVNYYNPRFNLDKKYEPTTFLCYQVSQKKEDMWIALLGCISDKFLPDFYSDFKKEYPDLSLAKEKRLGDIDAFDIIYNAPVGKISQMLNAGLKDKVTNVVKMLNFLVKARTPYEVLQESEVNERMIERFNEIDSKQKKLIKKASVSVKPKDKYVLFTYEGDMSLTGELSNELSYRFPGKIIVILYVNGPKVNVSMRGKGVREIIEKAMVGLGDSRGGGHAMAVGGQIRKEDLEIFKGRVLDMIEKS